jgi:hypothetical protein
MTLDVLGTNQTNLERPTSPRDPNGIAHATNSTDIGDGAATKASRAAAKIAWSRYVQDYKQAVIIDDSSGPPEFPDGSEIVYFNEGSSIVIDNLVVHLDAGNTDSYSGTGTTWTNLVDDTDYTINDGAFDSANGGSIVFNGSSTFVDIGTPLSNGTDFTKEAWVNADVVTPARNILSSESNVFWNNGSTLSGGVGDAYSLVTSANFPTAVWRHVVLTFDDDNNTMRLYINGTQVSENTGVTQSYVSEIERIGAHFFGGNPVSFWDGKIAEVRVYSEALADTDVLANYDNTKARYGL